MLNVWREASLENSYALFWVKISFKAGRRYTNDNLFAVVYTVLIVPPPLIYVHDFALLNNLIIPPNFF